MNFCERDLLAEPPGLAELRRLAEMAGVGVRDLVNTKSQAYRKMKPDLDSLEEKEVAALIKANPRLLVRPILARPPQIERGFSAASYQALLDRP